MYPSLRLRAFVLPLALLAVACGPELITPTPPITDPALATFSSKLGIQLATFTKTASGLYIKDVPAGFGSAADSGHTVSVDYVGYFTDGSIFDSSRLQSNGTFSFKLGEGAVIAGWDEGVKGMRVGGKRRLVVPPELGYGATGSGTVRPNSILVFDITLHGIR